MATAIERIKKKSRTKAKNIHNPHFSWTEGGKEEARHDSDKELRVPPFPERQGKW